MEASHSILKVIDRANGNNNIFSNAAALNAEYGYIQNQAPGGVLQRYQKVEVAKIPKASK